MKRRATSVSVLLVLMTFGAVWGSDAARRPAHPLDPCAQVIVGALNELRVEAGMQRVTADSVASYWTACTLSESVAELGAAFFDGTTGLELAERSVPDWERRCFIVTAGSDVNLLEEFRSTPGVHDAALDPMTTHAIIAVGATSDGGVWGSACLVHRLVQLGPTGGMSIAEGPSSVTVSGTTGHHEVLLRAHRTDEGAVGADWERPSVSVLCDESGAFSATLWFRASGPAWYDVVVLVRGEDEDEFHPATRVRHFAPKPTEMSGPAKVTRIESD